MLDSTLPTALEHDLATLQTLAFQVLEDGDFQDRWDVAKVFSALGGMLTHADAIAPLPGTSGTGSGTGSGSSAPNRLESLISPLIDCLQDDAHDPELHWFVTRILSEFRQADVLAALIDLLKTSDTADLQDIAAMALAGFGATAVPALTTLLEVERTRLLAVQTLARIREPACVEPLMQVLHDDDPAVRAAAIAALGSTRDRRIPHLLIEALQDPDAAVRQAAVTNLGFRADLLPQVDLVVLIQSLLTDINPTVCQQSAIALSRLATPTATVALADTAQSPQTPLTLQIECVRALGWMSTRPAITALHSVLHHLLANWTTYPAPADVVLELIKALGRTKSAELQHQATIHLIAYLQACPPPLQTPAIKQAIALELATLGDPSALDSLLHLATDSELSVKLHAIAALKHLNPTHAHQQLTAWAADESNSDAVRQSAAIALQEWG